MAAIRSIFVCCWTLFAVCGLVLEAEGGFREIGLQLHNDYRDRYGYLPLQLSSELNRIAHNHAENLANAYQFGPSPSSVGAKQNLWAHRGELRPISLDVRDAVSCWYTGNTFPGNTVFEVKPNTLYAPDVHYLGIGVGTNEYYNYTVVVANYM